IFLSRRTPDRDEEVFRDNRKFVEDEEQKQIEAEEYAIDPTDEREIKREKLFRALLDVPGKKNSRHSGDAREQHERQTDPIRREMIMNAERRNPRRVTKSVQARAGLERSDERDGKSRQRCQQRNDSRGARIVARQERQNRRSEKRNVNGPP